MRTPVVMALVALFLTSCLEVEQTIEIRSDGSGTQKLRLGMTERALQAATRHAGVAQASDPARIFDADLVRREVSVAGLVCKNVKTFEERRRRFVEVEAEFANLAALAKSPLTGTGAEWSFQPGPKPDTARVVFYPRGRAAWLAAQKKARELGDKLSDSEQRYFQRAVGQIRGLEVKWILNLPGDVVSCSSGWTKTDKRQVTATINAGRIKTAKDLILHLAPRYEVVLDSRQCGLLRGAKKARASK